MVLYYGITRSHLLFSSCFVSLGPRTDHRGSPWADAEETHAAEHLPDEETTRRAECGSDSRSATARLGLRFGRCTGPKKDRHASPNLPLTQKAPTLRGISKCFCLPFQAHPIGSGLFLCHNVVAHEKFFACGNPLG